MQAGDREAVADPTLRGIPHSLIGIKRIWVSPGEKGRYEQSIKIALVAAARGSRAPGQRPVGEGENADNSMRLHHPF